MELQWRFQEGKSKVRAQLWQVQHPLDTPSQGFWGANCTRGAAGLGLGMEVMETLQLGQGLAPTHTHICTRAALRESSSAQNGTVQPLWLPESQHKIPLATASPVARQERLRAAHRAALLIPVS